MLDNHILDEALVKKNKEIDKLLSQMEEMKRNYESKIKNLMNGVSALQKQNENLENSSKDNIRVNLLNKIKEERKDQEQVIELLRKMIADDERVDKYLMKEFEKKGAQRAPTYEELKIKIRQLEVEMISLKHKNSTTPTKKEIRVEYEYDDTAIQLKVVEKFREDVRKYEEQIQNLKDENEALKNSKDKMERLQTELYKKLKNYNEEIGEMKGIYEVIKKNISDETNTKTVDLTNQLSKAQSENKKHKEKILELIEISEQSKKEHMDLIKKMKSENEILLRILESKKQEISVLTEELNRYKDQFDKLDNKEVVRNKKIGAEKEEISRRYVELDENVQHLESVIRQKEYQIEVLKQTLSDKDEIVNEKENEIEMLKGKIEEMENLGFTQN